MHRVSKFLLGVIAGAVIFGVVLFDYIRKPMISAVDLQVKTKEQKMKIAKTTEERIVEARQKSENRKGVYMSYEVAVDRGAAATRIRENIFKLFDETELNAVVIDVKEAKGTTVSDGLRDTVRILHEKNVWVIARMTMMRDNSQIKTHPEFYIRRADGNFWRDNHRNAWLDPAHRNAWKYNAEEVKKAIDIGFDEIQYDYVRFPSDGNMKNISYPAYNSKIPKYEIIKNFLVYMNRELKSHKPEIILSADLFGYVAVQINDFSIGQRLIDIGDSVDYLSLMVYPSHYYSGFFVPQDVMRGLPSVFIPYKDPDSKKTVSSQPYEVVYRSMLMAGDVLSGRATTTKTGSFVVATSTIATTPISRAKMRPWLQDFDLGVDKARGIYYDATKVRAQIKASEDAGTSGWLLWDPSNVYTKEALHAE